MGGDCAIRGPADDLYLLLWNRREATDGIEVNIAVNGGASLLTLFGEKLQVRWS